MTDIAAPSKPANQRQAARLQAEAREAKQARTLVTPEGARLTLKIASGGERAGAFTIDFIIQWVIIIAGVLAIIYAASGAGFDGAAIAGAVGMVFVFAVRNFYFIAFELGRRAATPGKRLLGLRVAARDGGRLTANAVLARNFMREIEVFLPLSFLLQAAISGDPVSGLIGSLGFLWSGVFLFFLLFNRDKLRAGDMIAGTWVIHAPKATLMSDIASGEAGGEPGAFAFTPAQVDVYGIHELHVLENVLRGGAQDVERAVADRIRGKIGWSREPGESDRAFLGAYYAALRARLEQRMLLGERKADKFS